MASVLHADGQDPAQIMTLFEYLIEVLSVELAEHLAILTGVVSLYFYRWVKIGDRAATWACLGADGGLQLTLSP